MLRKCFGQEVIFHETIKKVMNQQNKVEQALGFIVVNTRGASFVAWLFHFHERKRLFLRFPQILHLTDDHYKYSWISMFIITLNIITVILHRLSAKSSLTRL